MILVNVVQHFHPCVINIHTILTKIAAITILSLPIIYRNEENCKIDDDCPHIMKCCQIGFYKYCCTPNNYIKLEPLYDTQNV